jgi:hypothetical protein
MSSVGSAVRTSRWSSVGAVAAAVHLPAQAQHQRALPARLQPGVQQGQQAARAEQQGTGVFHVGRQLQRLVKGFGQREPGIQLGLVAEGLVQRIEQPVAKAPHQPAARQRAQVAPGAAAQALQCGQMRTGGSQRGQRQLGWRRGGTARGAPCWRACRRSSKRPIAIKDVAPCDHSTLG